MILTDINFNSSIYRLYEIVGYWHLVNKKRTIITYSYKFNTLDFMFTYSSFDEELVTSMRFKSMNGQMCCLFFAGRNVWQNYGKYA